MQPKRILISILVVILLTFCTLTAFATASEATLDLAVSASSDTATVEDGKLVLAAGDVVEISVTAGEWDGALRAGQIVFTYDVTALELVEDSVVMPEGAILASKDGELKVQFLEAFPADTVILTARFTVLNAAHGAVNVAVSGSINDANWDNISVTPKYTDAALLAHAMTSEVTAPTCLEAGYTTHYCTVEGCDYGYVTDPVDALGHDESGAEATCLAAKVCAREDCDVELSPKLDHQAGANDNPCLNDTLCINGCGKVMLPATGHDATGPDATCTTDKVCANGCGAVLVAKLGHVPGPEADCTTAQICTRENCGATLAAALGHVPGAAATCTTAQVCTREDCGAELAKALGHKFNVAEATCDVAKVCSVCKVIDTPALGHDYGDWTLVEKATRSQNGIEEQACLRCDAKQTREVEFTGLPVWAIILIIVGSILLLIIIALVVFYFLKKDEIKAKGGVVPYCKELFASKKAVAESDNTTKEDSAESTEEVTEAPAEEATEAPAEEATEETKE